MPDFFAWANLLLRRSVGEKEKKTAAPLAKNCPAAVC
jgi:hypothetical protein